MKKFDLIVIGAGPSGYAAAMRALDFKKKTLLVEKNWIGGAGVTNGALSSKTWWELARETASFRKNLKKFNLKVPSLNYLEIQAEVRRAVAERKTLLQEHIQLMQGSKDHKDLLTFKTGTAKLLGQHEIEVVNDDENEQFQAD